LFTIYILENLPELEINISHAGDLTVLAAQRVNVEQIEKVRVYILINYLYCQNEILDTGKLNPTIVHLFPFILYYKLTNLTSGEEIILKTKRD